MYVCIYREREKKRDDVYTCWGAGVGVERKLDMLTRGGVGG